MRKLFVYVIAAAALSAVPLLAQSGSNETLVALITEVRLLRQALERNASAPQVQLLGTRLQVQNERVRAAAAEHETARNALRDAMMTIEQLSVQGADDDPVGQTPEHRRQLQESREHRKQQLAILSRTLPELQANEAGLAAAVAEEQNQWMLLNRRLDEIERGLAK